MSYYHALFFQVMEHCMSLLSNMSQGSANIPGRKDGGPRQQLEGKHSNDPSHTQDGEAKTKKKKKDRIVVGDQVS